MNPKWESVFLCAAVFLIHCWWPANVPSHLYEDNVYVILAKRPSTYRSVAKPIFSGLLDWTPFSAICLNTNYALRKRHRKWWLMVLAVNVSLRHSFIWSVRCVPLDTWVCLGLSILRVWWALEMCINGRMGKRNQKIHCLPFPPLQREPKKSANGHQPIGETLQSHWTILFFLCQLAKCDFLLFTKVYEKGEMDHFQLVLECFAYLTFLTPKCPPPQSVLCYYC